MYVQVGTRVNGFGNTEPVTHTKHGRVYTGWVGLDPIKQENELIISG